MFDRRIAELERIVEADPKNKEAQLALFHSEVRAYGPNHFCAPIQDWRKWKKTFPVVQDHILKSLQFTRLHFWHSRVWKCQNVDLCSECVGLISSCKHCKGTGIEEKTVSMRLPIYNIPSLEMQFVLVPGDLQKDIKPLLVARWPLTIRQEKMSEGGNSHGVGARRYSWMRYRRPENPNEPTIKRFESALKWCRKNKMRLPTVKEWHYLASATTDTTFYWGNDWNPDYAWTQENCTILRRRRSNSGNEDNFWLYRPYNAQPRPLSVKIHEKQKKWNAFSLVDIIGNVWEWTTDKNTGVALGSSYRSRQPSHLKGQNTLRLHRHAVDIGFRPVIDIC